MATTIVLLQNFFVFGLAASEAAAEAWAVATEAAAIILVNGPPLWHFRAQYFIDSFFFGHPPNLSTVVKAKLLWQYILLISKPPSSSLLLPLFLH